MQIILFMLGLFAIGCVLYGISEGVQVIMRGFARLAGGAKDSAPGTNPLAASPSSATAKAANASAPRRDTPQPEAGAGKPANASPLQRSIDELRDIFALYKQGALTQAEFEDMKQCLLAGIKTSAPQGH